MSDGGAAGAYLGTSEFAAVVLRALAASGHRPLLVVTPPDRRQGRGRKLSPPPVAEAARELGLPLHQTASVNDPDSAREILDRAAGVGSVCAFGQLIGEPLLGDLPLLNVHPSLLPRWRGAAPIERAIMAGDPEVGVCIMRLTAGLDSGPVALREQLPVDGRAYGELAPELARLGGELLVRALDLHSAGGLEFEAQPEQGVTYAEKIEAADRRLDPGAPAVELERAVRALTPHIGAFLELEDGSRLGVREAAAVAGELESGSLSADGERLLVGCGEGSLAISVLQPPGKRPMSAADWLRGHQLATRVRVG